jgi:glutamyl-Q tRNA(Asp) synthetase
LSTLSDLDLIYACRCSRRDVTSGTASASGQETRYPGTCAELSLDSADEPGHLLARRVRVSTHCEVFNDVRLGLQVQCPAEQCGDFLVRDRIGNFTYQFAVTVDDWRQNIDFVIRGEDLLPSTGRQIQLARLLGRSSPPTFLHHALVMRADGIKLSKSLGDTGVREMRDAGRTPGEVLAQAALASGLVSEAVPLAASELFRLFV